MTGWRDAAVVTGVLASVLCGWAAASFAAECEAAQRTKLPRCVAWDVDHVLGIRIRNQCRFGVGYVVVPRKSAGTDIVGRAGPDETVIAVTSITRNQVQGVFCCRDLGSC